MMHAPNGLIVFVEAVTQFVVMRGVDICPD